MVDSYFIVGKSFCICRNLTQVLALTIQAAVAAYMAVHCRGKRMVQLHDGSITTTFTEKGGEEVRQLSVIRVVANAEAARNIDALLACKDVIGFMCNGLFALNVCFVVSHMAKVSRIQQNIQRPSPSLDPSIPFPLLPFGSLVFPLLPFSSYSFPLLCLPSPSLCHFLSFGSLWFPSVPLFSVSSLFFPSLP